jgi:AbrB family looped-hinge helix DNA binding protein
MRYNAKVTSKGQITIPAEVRRALELEPGASVAFEVSDDHAVLTRQQAPAEYFAEARRRFPLPPSKYSSDREGLDEYFREEWEKDQHLGPGWIIEGGVARRASAKGDQW